MRPEREKPIPVRGDGHCDHCYHCPSPDCERHNRPLTVPEAFAANGLCPQCGAELINERGVGFFKAHGDYP
jgi:hypothetical protein